MPRQETTVGLGLAGNSENLQRSMSRYYDCRRPRLKRGVNLSLFQFPGLPVSHHNTLFLSLRAPDAIRSVQLPHSQAFSSFAASVVLFR